MRVVLYSHLLLFIQIVCNLINADFFLLLLEFIYKNPKKGKTHKKKTLNIKTYVCANSGKLHCAFAEIVHNFIHLKHRRLCFGSKKNLIK